MGEKKKRGFLLTGNHDQIRPGLCDQQQIYPLNSLSFQSQLAAGRIMQLHSGSPDCEGRDVVQVYGGVCRKHHGLWYQPGIVHVFYSWPHREKFWGTSSDGTWCWSPVREKKEAIPSESWRFYCQSICFKEVSITQKLKETKFHI